MIFVTVTIAKSNAMFSNKLCEIVESSIGTNDTWYKLIHNTVDTLMTWNVIKRQLN